jgi:hypothetical protein
MFNILFRVFPYMEHVSSDMRHNEVYLGLITNSGNPLNSYFYIVGEIRN